MSTSTDSTAPTKHFLNIDERAYKYIRQFSIKNPSDAIVELVTNSIDAYSKSNVVLQPASDPAPTTDPIKLEIPKPWNIMIKYYMSDNSLWVIDNACGLNAAKMSECFLNVGNFTSSDSSRGFFSRGAKDISILGDVTFESIKDDLYSKCSIDKDAYGMMEVSDQPVTYIQRDNLGIPLNGMAVHINLLPTMYISNLQTFLFDLTKRGTLREIFADLDNNITYQIYNTDGTLDYFEKIVYTFPPGDLLLDLSYNIPDYNTTARFTVYKARTPIPQPDNDNQLEFGFLIESKYAVYEVSTLDTRFRWNPYMNMLYGRLECDYIHTLMHLMDSDGITPTNPTTIIDPSRFSGLNADHPFTSALLAVPLVRLDYILTQLDQNTAKASVTLSEFNDILKEIENFGLDIFDTIPVQQSWQQDYNSELIQAIKNDRQNFVNVERNFMLESTDVALFPSTDPINMQFLTNPNVNRSSEYIYIVDDNNETIEIHTNGINIMSPNIDPDVLKKFYDYISQQISPAQFVKNPYIYAMNDNGDPVKLYVFGSGLIDSNPLNASELNSIKNNQKVININFTKDINQKYRYTLAITNKIDITINLNDPIVSKYLTYTDLSSDTSVDPNNLSLNMSALSGISNNKTYTFLSELFTEIFTRVVLYGKVANQNIQFDDPNGISKMNKVYSYYETIASSLQVPIGNIFDKYYQTNSTNMINQLMSDISSKVSDPSIFDGIKDNLLANFNNLF